MPKRSLRKQLLARRRSLSIDEWVSSSLKAQQALLSLNEFGDAGCIAVYAPVGNEADTALIVAAAFEAGKRVLYPAICGNDMVFRHVEDMSVLEPGRFGILEPCFNGTDHPASEADMIVVPGIAYDYEGHRIGYGKGFYDRFLQQPGLKASLVGFCHDFQIVEGGIPAEEHDVRMDLIVSDRRIVRCRSSRRHSGGPDSHRGGY